MFVVFCGGDGGAFHLEAIINYVFFCSYSFTVSVYLQHRHIIFLCQLNVVSAQ